MSFLEPSYVSANGLHMAVYETGPKNGTPIVLCHGWPEIAYAWRRQMTPLAEAGFRVITPDQRGFGYTEGPKGKDAVPLYDMQHLTGDLVGLLDALKIDKAIFCGHDWGGIVAWQLPLLHPSRVAGIIGVNTPYIPRPAYDPIKTFRRLYGENMYIVQFQKFGEAEKVLERDTAASLRYFYRHTGMTIADFDKLPAEYRTFDLMNGIQMPESQWPAGAPLLNAEELAYYTKAFNHSGWEGGINWYRNFSRNWEMSKDLPRHIRVPSLMISAADDIALRPSMADGMEEYIADLEKYLIPDCGHWTQIEQTEKLNHIMLDWLTRKFG